MTDRPARPTLPIRVSITDGESMHSWLEALAVRYRMTVRELLPSLGLDSPRRAYGLVNGLDPAALRLIERQAGLTEGRLEDAVLDRFAPLGLSDQAREGPLYRRWERWARASGSNFCPPSVLPRAAADGACHGISSGHLRARGTGSCLPHAADRATRFRARGRTGLTT